MIWETRNTAMGQRSVAQMSEDYIKLYDWIQNSAIRMKYSRELFKSRPVPAFQNCSNTSFLNMFLHADLYSCQQETDTINWYSSATSLSWSHTEYCEIHSSTVQSEHTVLVHLEKISNSTALLLIWYQSSNTNICYVFSLMLQYLFQNMHAHQICFKTYFACKLVQSKHTLTFLTICFY